MVMFSKYFLLTLFTLECDKSTTSTTFLLQIYFFKRAILLIPSSCEICFKVPHNLSIHTLESLYNLNWTSSTKKFIQKWSLMKSFSSPTLLISVLKKIKGIPHKANTHKRMLMQRDLVERNWNTIFRWRSGCLYSCHLKNSTIFLWLYQIYSGAIEILLPSSFE
jgi:hypothetical protein